MNRLLPIILVALGSAACANSTRILIQSAHTTNDGRSFYVMVRPLEDEDVVADSYEAAARRVFAREAAPVGQERRVIIPGQTMTMDIPTDRQRDIVLYFFFTEPGDRWWFAVDKERLASEIIVELGLNEVERVRVRGR